jgi:Fe2+ transport system protein FeoA
MIKSNDPNAIQDLTTKLDVLKRRQQKMVAANKIIKGKGTAQYKTERLLDMGYDEGQALKLLKGDFMGRVGFAQYQLSSNNAEIKRVEARLESLTKLAETRTETTEWLFAGGRVIDNVEANRVQVVFDAPRISAEEHAKMRSNGFVFSPTNKAYQRQRGNARWAVWHVTGIDIDKDPAEA